MLLCMFIYLDSHASNHLPYLTLFTSLYYSYLTPQLSETHMKSLPATQEMQMGPRVTLKPSFQITVYNTATQKCCHATFTYSTCSQTLTLNNIMKAAVNSKMKPVRPLTYKNMVLIQIQYYKGIYYLKHLNSAYGHFWMWYIK